MFRKFLLLVSLAMLCAGACAKTVVIDVRTPDEYAVGHLAGAINIEHQLIAQRIASAGIGKDDEVILYCNTGRRAGVARTTLMGLGYKHVENYGSMEDARWKILEKLSG